MANTYSQLYIHIVFAVKWRANRISPNWKIDLYKYINGTITGKGQKLLAINGMPDHIHLLLSIGPEKRISDLVRDIKANSSRFINEHNWVSGKFEWQNGYGSFSVSQSKLEIVRKYIANQESHHQTQSFLAEYAELLRSHGVEFEKEYIFNGG